ncbi:MAG: DegQ family serine endoprotease [Pseudomonadota bacterium]
MRTMNLFFPLLIVLSFAVPQIVSAQEPAPAPTMNNAPSSFADLAERLTPAVVNVSSTARVETDFELDEGAPGMPDFQFPEGSPFQDFFEEFMDRRDQFGGGRRALPAASLGSGFIIDAENGYIVTNNHVVKDADEVRITLHDDSTIDAEIIGRDEKIDIAVLKVETDKELTAVPFGNSSDMRVGDWVVAIGNPFGLGGTVTAGIVSARQRDINSGPYDDYIQTDASINRGNSGGPMFNLNGEVIGINTAIFSPSGGSVGIGFAIPSNLSKPVIDQLIKFGRTKRGWLGVRIQTVTDEIADSLGLDSARGALVADVTPGGPAEKAKFESGDIILEFDGKPIDTMRELPRIVAETDIEKEVTVKYWRDGKERTAKVSIGELEKAEEDGLLASNDNGPSEAGDKGSAVEKLGMNIAPLTNANRERFNISDDTNGVVITEIKRGSAAEEEGLSPGDVIEEINQQSVESVKDVREIVKKVDSRGKSSVLLLINREGDVRFTAVKLAEDDKKKDEDE